MRHFALRSGASMPGIGLGTWKSDKGVVGEAVKSALELGYRHLDCAAIYRNEAEIGQALQDVWKTTDLKRQDVFMTSKLWNTEHAPQDVEVALRQTLADMQVDYLDLYLMHWPIAQSKEDGKMLSLEEVPIMDTWKAMEECVDKGLVKDIGVSNFSKKKLKQLVETARIAPSVNQVELHPYLQMGELHEYCQQSGVLLTAYSPLGSMDRPKAMRKDDEVPVLQDPLIAKIASKHNATPAQVLVGWAVQRGTSVIPKSISAKRQAENLESANIVLDSEDMDAIATLDRHARYLDGAFWFGKNSPYTKENLWDEGAVSRY